MAGLVDSALIADFVRPPAAFCDLLLRGAFYTGSPQAERPFRPIPLFVNRPGFFYDSQANKRTLPGGTPWPSQ